MQAVIHGPPFANLFTNPYTEKTFRSDLSVRFAVNAHIIPVAEPISLRHCSFHVVIGLFLVILIVAGAHAENDEHGTPKVGRFSSLLEHGRTQLP